MAKKYSGDYKQVVRFYPDADTNVGRSIEFHDSELKSRLGPYVGEHVRISEVAIYSTPIFFWQFTKIAFFHLYVVFEAGGYCWSIEKDAHGVYLQRSKTQRHILNYCQGVKRSASLFRGVELEISDTANCSFRTFCEMLWASDAVGESYGLLSNNCKDFAKLVFNRISLNRNY